MSERRAVLDLFLAGGSIMDRGCDQVAHGLRLATIAKHHRVPDDLVVAGLFHDVGKPLNMVHHGDVSAAILRGRIADVWLDLVRRHGEYVADIHHETTETRRYEAWSLHELARRFARWDIEALRPGPFWPLDTFEPLIVQRWPD
jgi:predicted HD phosphohydrolase